MADHSEHLPQDRQTQEQLKLALRGTAARLLKQVDEQDSDKARSGAPSAADETKLKTDRLAEAAKREGERFFFDLNSARWIPKCVVTQRSIKRNRGPIRDLWDEGFTISSDPSVRMATVLLLVAGLLSVEWLTRKLLKLA